MTNAGDSLTHLDVTTDAVYRLEAIDSFIGCKVVSNKIEIIQYDSLETPSLVILGDSIVSIGSYFSGETYNWFFETDSFSTTTSSFILVTEIGMYSLIVTDTNGCVTFSTSIQYVDVGLYDPNDESRRPILNISNGFVVIEGIGTYSQLKVFSTSGHLVISQSIQPPSVQLSTNELAAGLYYWLITGKFGFSQFGHLLLVD